MKRTVRFLVIILLIIIFCNITSCADPSKQETVITEKIEIPMAVDTKMPTKIFTNQNQRVLMYRFDDGYFTCFVTSNPSDLVCFNK